MMSNISKSNDVRNVCNICDKSFSSWSNLVMHKEMIHEKKTVIDCKVCGKQLGSKNAAKFHFDAIHRKIRYACEKCDKSYTSKVNLKTHVTRDHNGVIENIPVIYAAKFIIVWDTSKIISL